MKTKLAIALCCLPLIAPAAELTGKAAAALQLLESLTPPQACVPDESEGELKMLSVRWKQERLELARLLYRDAVMPLRDIPILESVIVYMDTPQHEAKLAELLQALIAAGALADGPLQDGAPLLEAVETGSTAACRVLLDAGARPDVSNSFGHSAVYLAASHHHPACLELLLAAGCKPDLPGKDFSLLHVAISDPEEEDCHCGAEGPNADDVVATCRVLLQHGVDVNTRNANGETPLHEAASLYNTSHALVRLLLESGADASLASAEGTTPLDKALEFSDEELCRMLCEAGGTLGKGSPLKLAVLFNDLAALKELLPSASQDELQKLLNEACCINRWEACRMLIEFGVTWGDGELLASSIVEAPEDLQALLLSRADVLSSLDAQSMWGAIARQKDRAVPLCRRLLAAGLDVRRGAPLLEAAKTGHADLCRVLLEAGADANAHISGTTFTPLGEAVRVGDADLCRLLLAAGANPNGAPPVDKSSARPSALPHSLNEADQPAAEAGKSSSFVGSPLHIALEYDECSIADILLAAGAELNWQDAATRKTLLDGLVYSPNSKNHTNSLRWLLDHGADAAWRADALRLLLGAESYSCRCISAEACEMLLAAGTSLPEGWQPLHLRVAMNQPLLCRELIAAGADVNAKTAKGMTPLIMAITQDNTAMCELLLKAHARTDIPNAKGEFPLTIAVTGNRLPILRLLLSAGAALEAREAESGFTALARAACHHEELSAAQLLVAGANPNVRCCNGFTPLHLIPYYAGGKRSLMYRMLLAYGADPLAKDDDGRLPQVDEPDDDTDEEDD